MAGAEKAERAFREAIGDGFKVGHVRLQRVVLESTLGIKAERLKGYEMYRTVTEFFRASSIVIPSKTFRVLTLYAVGDILI